MRTTSHPSRPIRLAAALAVLLTVPAGCADDDGPASVTSTVVERTQMVLDYSPTLSDAGALLYLASNPEVELLAVTLPGTGEADCEPGTRVTRGLLALAGRADIPVGCGRNTPLVGDRDWPEEWRAQVNNWDLDTMPAVDAAPVRDAERLLSDTLTDAIEPVTVVAVGPLTNLGVVLDENPELGKKIREIVIMGGAVDVPGNVEAAPTAEGNLYIDPEAARRVIASDVPVVFVPLDATNNVPWTNVMIRWLGALDSPAAQTVHDLAESRESLEGFYLWDELAAIAAVHRGFVTIERRTIAVDEAGAIVSDPDGPAVDVAIGADARMATDEFLYTLNGGPLPVYAPLTTAELDYFIAMNGTHSRIKASLQGLFTMEMSDNDLVATATEFARGYFGGVTALIIDLGEIVPPESTADLHRAYVESLTQFVGLEDEMLAAIAEAEGTTPWDLLQNAAEAGSFEPAMAATADTCTALEDYAVLRGGPTSCSLLTGD